MVKHSSRIELSQSALKANFNFIRKKIDKKDVLISAVVKANAYGHGYDSYIKMVEKCGINHFSVASAHEAEMVKSFSSEKSNIMIMGILYEEDISWAIKNDIEFYVFNYDRLLKVNEFAKKLNKKAIVHIETETGANRTGMSDFDFYKSLTFLKKKNSNIDFKGLCSHFGGAESFSNRFKIDAQLKKFKEQISWCKKKNILPGYIHIASSAATLFLPESHFNMVRVGVSQYGFWPSPDIFYDHIQKTGSRTNTGLKRVFTWKTDIMDIKNVKSGSFVGYGTAFQAVRDMRVAVLPLGYSNGYPRGLSNTGQVLIRGKKAQIIGLINMNLFTVDISHIPDAEVGDEVVLIGRQKNHVINISSFSNFVNLLNNEMMSRLPAAIPRKAVR
ncbi:MAG: alanine racemase [Chitinophagaceae bacterium]|nr:MAG: alanine racemase [Chitinophagaceae bacterium]